MSERDNQPLYMVWDMQEVLEVSTQQDLRFLDNIIDRIIRKREEKGKETTKRFVVVPDDSPYFRAVSKIISNHKEEGDE